MVARNIFSFQVTGGNNVTLGEKPKFAVRAFLANPGTSHPQAMLGDHPKQIPSDPCRRLAIQYRPLLENTEQDWKWASAPGTRGASDDRAEKRVWSINTFVYLLEGKDPRELRDFPRVNLGKWNFEGPGSGKFRGAKNKGKFETGHSADDG